MPSLRCGLWLAPLMLCTLVAAFWYSGRPTCAWPTAEVASGGRVGAEGPEATLPPLPATTGRGLDCGGEGRGSTSGGEGERTGLPLPEQKESAPAWNGLSFSGQGNEVCRP